MYEVLKDSEDCCSFCGMARSEVHDIVVTPCACICDKCIEVASEMVRNRHIRRKNYEYINDNLPVLRC